MSKREKQVENWREGRLLSKVLEEYERHSAKDFYTSDRTEDSFAKLKWQLSKIRKDLKRNVDYSPIIMERARIVSLAYAEFAKWRPRSDIEITVGAAPRVERLGFGKMKIVLPHTWRRKVFLPLYDDWKLVTKQMVLHAEKIKVNDPDIEAHKVVYFSAHQNKIADGYVVKTKIGNSTAVLRKTLQRASDASNAKLSTEINGKLID